MPLHTKAFYLFCLQIFFWQLLFSQIGSHQFSTEINQKGKDQYFNNGAFPKGLSQDWGDSPDWAYQLKFGGSSDDNFIDLVKDNTGNYYAVAEFSGKLGIGELELTSSGFYDMLLIKFSPNWEVLWHKQWGGEEKDIIRPSCISYNSINNEVFVGGYYSGENVNSYLDGETLLNSGGYDNGFVIKYSNDGVFDWSIFDSNVDEHRRTVDLEFSEERFLYQILALGSGESYSSRDHQVKKLSPNLGQQVWTRTVESNINSLKSFGDKIYLAGTLKSENTYFENFDNLFNESYNQFFLAQLNSLGDFLWVRHPNLLDIVSRSYGLDVILNDEGEVYLAASISGEVIFDETSYFGESLDLLICKFDSLGNSIVTKKTTEAELTSNTKFVYSNGFIYSNIQSKSDFTIDGLSLDGQGKTNVLRFNQENLGAYLLIESTIESKTIAVYENHLLLLGNYNGTMEIEDFNSYGELIVDGGISSSSNSGIIPSVWQSIKRDSQGNIYFVTSVEGTCDFFDGSSLEASQRRGLLVKMNADGIIEWKKEFISSNFSNLLKIDISSDETKVAVLGEFRGVSNIDGSVIFANLEDPFVAVINADDGSLVWIKSLETSSAIDQLNSISFGSDNSIVFSGTFRQNLEADGFSISAIGFDSGFIAKLNSEGSVSWLKSLGGEDNDFSLLSGLDLNDNIYFFAESFSEEYFIDEEIVLLAEGSGNIVNGKLNSDGEILWTNVLGGSTIGDDTRCWAQSLIVADDGNSYINGWFGRENAFGSIVLESEYNYNNFLAAFTPNGDTKWAYPIYFENYDWPSYQIDLDDHQNLYFGGRFRSNISFDETVNFELVGNRDLYVGKISSDGDLSWLKTIPGSEGSPFLSGISVGEEDQIFLIGFLDSPLSFDDNILRAYNSNGFIAGLGEGIDLSISDYYTANSDLEIFPNPTAEFLTFKVPLNREAIVDFAIFDQEGKRVKNKALNFQVGQELKIDISELSNGLYFFVCTEGQEKYKAKFIVAK